MLTLERIRFHLEMLSYHKERGRWFLLSATAQDAEQLIKPRMPSALPVDKLYKVDQLPSNTH